jgi:AAA15 family ATPase/GTPase
VNVSIPLIDAAKDMLRNNIMQIITPKTELMRYAVRKVSEDEELSNYILNFLHEADFNITDIKTEIVEKTIPENVMSLLLSTDNISEDIKEQIKNEKSIRQPKTNFEHTVTNHRGTEAYNLNLNNDEESRGTIQTFGLEAALYCALKRNAFLAIDEIETSLHPKLLEKIIFEYLRTESRSQIIVTTHNDGLLDLVDDLIRKDSVWFTEKKKSGVTDLYKLTDFRGVNRLSSIREAYRNKRFGATMN